MAGGGVREGGFPRVMPFLRRGPGPLGSATGETPEQLRRRGVGEAAASDLSPPSDCEVPQQGSETPKSQTGVPGRIRCPPPAHPGITADL